jgi:endonuclease YncB( thermonuclease family)
MSVYAIKRLVAISMGRRRADSAKVIDGDTIVVAGQLVRLHGIDAPELDQTFWWRVPRAARCLWPPSRRVKVSCEVVERDRHGRLVAKVYSPNGVDIGRRLVSAGWVYRRYSMN